jgi:hypothetical protein
MRKDYSKTDIIKLIQELPDSVKITANSSQEIRITGLVIIRKDGNKEILDLTVSKEHNKK